ncbi:MAG: deoxyribose-phosphate aldolase [Propionibacteriaceae bacterium]|nr:deoxyribose-phosphate aldolase [Propionibacteriaceae bacterium]
MTRKPAAEMTRDELAAYIDYSILKPEFTPTDIKREVIKAVDYGCKTVCINPSAIEIAKPLCEGSGTGLCVVADFPFGASSTASKVAQVADILGHGISELDIVANYGRLRGGELGLVESDLRVVADTCHEQGVAVKAILETDALTMAQVKSGADAAIAAGCDFIKTSTGFYTGEMQHDEAGAFEAMIDWMIQCAAGRCKVKGSAAIRDRDHFLRLIDAGIDRMGIGHRSVPVVLGDAASTAPSGTGY